MSELEGTARLAWLHVRRDRALLGLCALAIPALMLASAVSLKDVYSTPEERAQYAASFASDTAVAATQGNPINLETIGGILTFETGVWYSMFVALATLLFVNRYTRGDEEAGRLELVLAAAVGRRAPIAAALLVAGALSVLIGALVLVALVAVGYEAEGSLGIAAWFAGLGIVFAAIAALAAQLSESKRTTTGIALAALGVAWVLRAIGDAGTDAFRWLSPIGWGQEIHPFGEERWWPLGLMAAATVTLVAGAFALLRRRDIGGGLFATRPGPAAASRGLRSATGLAVRLLRPSLIAWIAGILGFGLVYGAITESIEEFIAENEQIAEIVAQAGGTSIVDSYLATAVGTLAVFGAGFAVQAALRPRTEESAGRFEALLATATSRQRLLGAYVAVAVVGSALVAAAAGLGTAVGLGLATGDWGDLGRLLAAALAYAPAMWVTAGIGILLVGAAPRAAFLAWATLAWFVVAELLAEVLNLPHALADLSPFAHVPEAPAAPLGALPVLVVAAVAAALFAAGIAAFRHRDAG
ncbi:MAG TPA: ABC transporter permease [Solirubrobacterales bacterium]|jgi:ABC-2 type transport system permease protein